MNDASRQTDAFKRLAGAVEDGLLQPPQLRDDVRAVLEEINRLLGEKNAAVREMWAMREGLEQLRPRARRE